MRVLFFEVTIPGRYKNGSFFGGGWQDSLENAITSNTNIELGVAFESSDKNDFEKTIDGISYFPLFAEYNVFEKFQNKYSFKPSREKILNKAAQVVERFKPDIIHVFGSEWCFGQIQRYTCVPVIIHMQGSIPAYNNALYPPGYSSLDESAFNLIHGNLKRLLQIPFERIKAKNWAIQEQQTLQVVANYMGRTAWDRCIVDVYHPKANYYSCNEVLRNEFINSKECWMPLNTKKIIISTTGCSTLWKGLDTIVKTAKILKNMGVDFCWRIYGDMHHKKYIEWKEDVDFQSLGIELIGPVGPERLKDELLKSSVYVHLAYIDNSPNSLCEAQYLGLPVIATYVGGIPSLIANHETGILVPANDPHVIAWQIENLCNNTDMSARLGKAGREMALLRHNQLDIIANLIKIYADLING